MRPVGRLGDVCYLDVGQPERTLRVVLRDAAFDVIAERERLVLAETRLDELGTPPEKPRVEVTSARQVPRAKLQVNYRIGDAVRHAHSLRLPPLPETNRRIAMSFRGSGGPGP